MNEPKDQGLFFTVFLVVSLIIVLTIWIFLPVYHKEEEIAEIQLISTDPSLTPEDRIKKAEQVLKSVLEILPELEAADEEKQKEEKKENAS